MRDRRTKAQLLEELKNIHQRYHEDEEIYGATKRELTILRKEITSIKESSKTLKINNSRAVTAIEAIMATKYPRSLALFVYGDETCNPEEERKIRDRTEEEFWALYHIREHLKRYNSNHSINEPRF